MSVLRIRVDLLPKPPYHGTVILVDVLRTCTSAAMLFERGLESLDIVDKLRLARQRAESTDATLLGERAGLPPEGFNYGNSLAELRDVVINKRAVVTSENAPKSLALLTGANTLLLGSLYNAGAVAEVASGRNDEDIFIVCSGFLGQEDLDDTLTAGFLAASLKAVKPEATLEGASRFAITLMQAFPDPLEALWRSSTGQYLRGLNMIEDLALASYSSQTDSVPMLQNHEQTDQGNIFTFVDAGSKGQKAEGKEQKAVVRH